MANSTGPRNRLTPASCVRLASQWKSHDSSSQNLVPPRQLRSPVRDLYQHSHAQSARDDLQLAMAKPMQRLDKTWRLLRVLLTLERWRSGWTASTDVSEVSQPREAGRGCGVCGPMLSHTPSSQSQRRFAGKAPVSPPRFPQARQGSNGGRKLATFVLGPHVV